jgi:hypothetical protein
MVCCVDGSNNYLFQLNQFTLNASTIVSHRIAVQLRNATMHSNRLFGRDGYIVYRILSTILDIESRYESNMNNSHIQDRSFIDNIITIASVLLDDDWWIDDDVTMLHLIAIIDRYGHRLAALHSSVNYLRPFQINTRNIGI